MEDSWRGLPSRLGDVLVAQGALTRETVEEYSVKVRGRIGEFLRAHNAITGQALSQALSHQHTIDFVDFAHAPPDARLFRPHALGDYMEHRFVPYARTEQGLVIATSNPSADLQVMLEAWYGEPLTLVGTGPRDMLDYFASVAATTATRHAKHGLRRKYKHLVADRTLLPPQLRGLALLVSGIALGLFIAPNSTWNLLLIACNIFYLLFIAIKFYFYREGLLQQERQRQQGPELTWAAALLEDRNLPVYSILVPIYKESGQVLARLIAALGALDYPREKLDIKLICESDDTDTIHVLKRLSPPHMMDIIVVPASLPRTKPKACNVALQQIRGEYLVIYDAEDMPAPDQLKRAVVLFTRSGPKLACLQGRLNYFNRDENLLTQLFAIEYSALFRINLPALERLQLPIPLGGTSNHLRVSVLNEVGGWDAFNVTEDADLGIRLAYLGYHTKMLPSLTLEEAPLTVSAWMKQRTRWIKGYIQTWLVYTRDPAELKRCLGLQGYYGFQFFVGAPALTFLLAPIFWAIYFISFTGWIPSLLSPFMQILCAVSFVSGIAINLIIARAVLRIEGWERMRLAMLLYPFYWLLHSLAAARALGQLIVRPHYWEKTKHGMTQFVVKDT